jgi:hypothetical protein
MEHSNTLVSNYINELYEANEIIQNSLLIGEQCAFINDAACIYNGLRSMITPEYLTDDEFHWMKSVANSWNDITRAYNKSLDANGMHNEDMHDNMQDLQDAIDHLLDDLNDMGDDIGPMET